MEVSTTNNFGPLPKTFEGFSQYATAIDFKMGYNRRRQVELHVLDCLKQVGLAVNIKSCHLPFHKLNTSLDIG
jgi:hypothetical protein